MKFIKYILIITLFPSCEDFWIKEANTGFSAEPKPVVHSFISPSDSLIRVELKYAEPAVGFIPEEQQESAPIKDAEVVVSKETDNIGLDFTDDYSVFADYYAQKEHFQIKEGETYTLKVSTQDGIFATSECTVPTGLVDLETLKIIEGGDDEIAFVYKDIPDAENYYAVALARYSTNDGVKLLSRYFLMDVFSDQYSQGQLISTEYYPKDGIDDEFILMLIDKNYYKYHKSLDEYRLIRDNPFAEPYNLYSNIEGGMGVFAAYKIIAIIKS